MDYEEDDLACKAIAMLGPETERDSQDLELSQVKEIHCIDTHTTYEILIQLNK